MIFILSDFLIFLLLEYHKLLEPNGYVKMRMNSDIHNSFVVLINHRYQDSTIDTLMLASVLYEHDHICLCKPNVTVKHKSMICQLSTNLISLDFSVH
jgi:hypothetical protein